MLDSDQALSVYAVTLLIVASLYPEIDTQKVDARITEIANGEVTVFDSMEEEIAKMEKLYGRFSEKSRKLFENDFLDRAAKEAFARRIATLIQEAIERDSL